MFYRFGLAMVRRRWLVLCVWLLGIAIAAPFAPRITSVLQSGGFSSPDMESQQAVDLLVQKLHYQLNAVQILFSSPTMTADTPQFIQEANAALAGLSTWSEVSSIVPFTENPHQISRDGHTAYTVVLLKGDPDSAPQQLPMLESKLGHPQDLSVQVGGGPVFYEDIQSVSEQDLRRAEFLAFPFALLALVLVFRSLVAAALPAIVGGCSVVVSFALVYWLGTLTPFSIFALNVITLFGLGLGVDYSLFIVSRFREELGRGKPVPEAIATSVATAGRAVFFSGVAVTIGLVGLTVFQVNMLRSVGLAGMVVVAISIITALTLLPAVLGILGTRVNAFPVRLSWLWKWRKQRSVQQSSAFSAATANGAHSAPGAGAQSAGRASGAEHDGFWGRLALFVMRYPLRVFLPVLAVLVLFGLPFLDVRLGAPDASILPQSVPSRQAYDVLQTQFASNETTPILVVVQTRGQVLDQSNLEALDAYVRQLESDPRVQRVDSIVSLDPRLTLAQYEAMYSHPDLIGDPYIKGALTSLEADNVTLVSVISKYAMLDTRTEALVQAIRNTTPPGGIHVLVDGGTAGVIDYVNTLYTDFPRALLLVALITYVVLLLLFRSVVLPLKAIVMNTLSILASYGALVFVFQQGHFSNLLNFTPLGYVEASEPILMFCALFGLSMDYEVFLLSRVRESWEATHDNRASVAVGLERSGRIVTSAALIVVVVSLSFVSADMILVKALGLGMALAVLLDATLVRGLLVPATMRLLGSWNWWLPGWLARLLPTRIHGPEDGPPVAQQAPQVAAIEAESQTAR
ncbi:MAG TPA: MMPL family transporter [Ktedonobacterales bacterium]|nr:MMPL family transporter [Ktedonobacterales bacterium]